MFGSPPATRLGLISLAAASSLLSADVIRSERVWQSADGREIRASVLALDPEAETVKMRRSDGLEFSIGFDQFATTDQQLLSDAAEKKAQAESEAIQEDAPNADQARAEPLPNRHELRRVPMVRQKGNFCVPASAAMIAGFHGIDTDQDQIAYLSSAQSISHQGTSPRDMLLAMEKLGFDGEILYWREAGEFDSTILPAIRRTLVDSGPIYISFRPGVFGDMGHGCVIIGYDDRREELRFHNPWGNVFTKKYDVVAEEARGLVLFEAPQPAPIASEEFIERMQEMLPKFDGGSFTDLPGILARHGQKHNFIWCSRHDARNDRRFAVDTARADGRKILGLAFHRNPAVLLPWSENGETQKYLFVTRPPEGGASFMVREINSAGWSEPELLPLGRLTRHWPTRIESDDPEKFIWELPMIELHPDD